ncbi:negative regulator of systemic acquired resistance SNI1 isoform X2 [Euphorbia lathyris]|uniref:negative regulator of systemic acquired resistance SNI1 isoform X2 n=1 Tax=Euphorbia lathyris TaxID=212925 RepID=UPI0033137A68
METFCSRRGSRARGGVEENILAIIDGNDSKDTQDANDDRIVFLQAVRAASLDQDKAAPPTFKMCEAVFQILRVVKSPELIMESFRLLDEIEKRFPRVDLSDKGAESSQPMVVEEAWSPFVFSSDITAGKEDTAGECSSGPFDSAVFYLLIQDLAEVINTTKFSTLDIKSLRKMLMFQYLINVLEGDFVSRNKAYEETMKWMFVKESLLSMLLSSRRISYKVLMKDCLSIMCGLCQVSGELDNDLASSNSSMEKPSQHEDIAVVLALPEVRNATRTAMQKLLTMIMDLDMSRKKADSQGSTTRADGVRTPLIEIILDELTYDTDMLSHFLQTYSEPKWKLEIVMQYFAKYTAKPSVRTRRSDNSVEYDGTLIGIFKCFSNVSSMKNITKKISKDVVQILLAHGFQDKVKRNTLVELCENLISAYRSLKSSYGKMEILPLGKEALFTAAAILSMET